MFVHGFYCFSSIVSRFVWTDSCFLDNSFIRISRCKLSHRRGWMWSNMPSTAVWWFALMSIQGVFSFKTCLIGDQNLLDTDSYTRPHLTLAERSMELILDVSHRPTHRMVSEAFRIFLSEVLGYPSVELHYSANSSYPLLDSKPALARIAGGEANEIGGENSMMNLGLWLSPANDAALDQLVRDQGNLAPPGRLGWFLPGAANNITVMVNHWTQLRAASTAQMFGLTPEDEDALRGLCSESCFNAMHVPSLCRNGPCGTILAPRYEDTKFLATQVDELGVRLKVLWLGDQLSEAVSRLQLVNPASGRTPALLVMTWTPGDIAPPGTASITLPPCEQYSSFVNAGCVYDPSRIAKFSWSGLSARSPHAAVALQNVRFSRDDLSSLIRDYRATGDPDRAACDWMRRNKPAWLQ